MKIIKNNVPQSPSEWPKAVRCRWCTSELEVEPSDLSTETVMYSQWEIVHEVLGYHCPCCGRFAPLR
jgi:hypothetical protein